MYSTYNIMACKLTCLCRPFLLHLHRLAFIFFTISLINQNQFIISLIRNFWIFVYYANKKDADEKMAASGSAAEVIEENADLSDMKRRFTLITAEEPIPTNEDDSVILANPSDQLNGISVTFSTLSLSSRIHLNSIFVRFTLPKWNSRSQKCP